MDLVLAVLTVVLGGVVLLNPFGTMEAMTVLIGASLVYDGASDLYLIYRGVQGLPGRRRPVTASAGRLREVNLELGKPTVNARHQAPHL